MTTTRIDECLATRDSHLFIEACDTVDLARRFGSPLFVISENQFGHFLFANRTDDPPVHVADIVGHSCYADRILPFVRVPAVEPGDLLALLDMGAYQEVSASNFNALPRPATVLVNGSRAEIVRRAETLDDVFRRDVIPERLQTARPA